MPESIALISATFPKISTFSFPFSFSSISISNKLIPDSIPCFIFITLPPKLSTLFFYSPSLSKIASCLFKATTLLEPIMSIATDFPAPDSPNIAKCGFASSLPKVSR